MEQRLESLIFASRWLLAPLYVGMVGSLLFLVVKFGQEFLHAIPTILSASETDVILAVLSLVDISLAANLLLMVIFAGYENFVSKIDTKGNPDRPDWMGKVDYSGLKMKMIASIVAISAIQLLKAFLHVQDLSSQTLGWMIGLHLTFVVSGVLLALMDRLIVSAHGPVARAEAPESGAPAETAVSPASPGELYRKVDEALA